MNHEVIIKTTFIDHNMIYTDRFPVPVTVTKCRITHKYAELITNLMCKTFEIIKIKTIQLR